MLAGSAARNKFDKFSDIDFCILTSKQGPKTRDNFLFKKTRVDIIFDTVKGTRSFLIADKGNVKRVTSHILTHGIIIFERGEALAKAQALAIKNFKSKTVLKPEEVLMHKYSIDDFLGEVRRDLKNGDHLAFGLNSQLLVNNVIELILKLRGSFWLQPNEMRVALKRLDRNLATMIDRFYKTTSYIRKEEILSEIVKYTYSISGGPLPKKWSLKD